MKANNATDFVTPFEVMRTQIHRPPLEEARQCEQHGEFVAKCHIGKMWSKCPVCAEEVERQEQERKEQERAQARARQWQERLGHSGIPLRFHDRTLSGYQAQSDAQQAALDFAKEYALDFEQVQKTGRGAVFVGRPGTGKTHLAVGIGLYAMRKFHARVLFITVQRAIRSVKDTWAKGAQQSESEAIDALVEPDLLILDEVGVQFGSEFERNTLFDVLNERYELRKPTIFLSNLASDELADFLGERVMDRLREDGGRVIPFAWDSYRGKAQA